MVRLFSCSERVAGNIAMRSSSSVPIAIEAIAIAAQSASNKLVFAKNDAPMNGTSAVQKANSIIATGNAPIESGNGPHRPA